MGVGRPDTVKERISELRGSLPRKESMKLIDNCGSVRLTIMQEAMAQSDSIAGESVEQWWLPDEGLVVIDLGVGEDE